MVDDSVQLASKAAGQTLEAVTAAAVQAATRRLTIQAARPRPQSLRQGVCMEATPRYWFPAKRYGWGWGVPQTWQGWLVLISYLVVVLAPAMLFEGGAVGVATLVAVVVASPLLIWVCFRKGEPLGSRE